LAWSRGLKLIGVDHIVAHLHACCLGATWDAPDTALGLVVSGGHTSLFRVHGPLEVEVIGHTIDDAVGEAYDKAAVILGLGYPGGPAVDRLAALGDEHAYDLPVSRLARDSLDFSFSGLKTALLYAVCGKPLGSGKRFERDASALTDRQRADFAASFQRAAVTALLVKVNRALDRFDDDTLLVGGGVSANSRLRAELEALARDRNITVRLPAPEYCLDNAAMIAGLAATRFQAGLFDDWTLSASTRSGVMTGATGRVAV
jgi:N6-L-threonylcarbamoyladenine synthase